MMTVQYIIKKLVLLAALFISIIAYSETNKSLQSSSSTRKEKMQEKQVLRELTRLSACKSEVVLDNFAVVFNLVSGDISKIENVTRDKKKFKVFLRKLSTLKSLAKRLDRLVGKEREREFNQLYPFADLVTSMKNDLIHLRKLEEYIVVSNQLSADLSFMSYDKELSHIKSIHWLIREQIETLRVFSFPEVKVPFQTIKDRLAHHLKTFFNSKNSFIADSGPISILDFISIADDEEFKNKGASFKASSVQYSKPGSSGRKIYMREVMNGNLTIRALGYQSMKKVKDETIPGRFELTKWKAWYKGTNGEMYTSDGFSSRSKWYSSLSADYLRKQLTDIRSILARCREDAERANVDYGTILELLERTRKSLRLSKQIDNDIDFILEFKKISDQLEKAVSKLST